MKQGESGQRDGDCHGDDDSERDPTAANGHQDSFAESQFSPLAGKTASWRPYQEPVKAV
jgi:hypothetical protein